MLTLVKLPKGHILTFSFSAAPRSESSFIVVDGPTSARWELGKCCWLPNNQSPNGERLSRSKGHLRTRIDRLINDHAIIIAHENCLVELLLLW